MSSSVKIKFENIGKSFGSISALQSCSFEVQELDFVALVGNNGCGKSTTIHILCNLTDYQSGEYYFENKKVSPQFVSFKENLGIVLSEPYYIEEFNVVEYWKFVAKFQKIAKNEIDTRIDDLINLLELREHTKQPIKSLSSGNQMKVSFGAALIHNPKILILDEPFVNLDIATTEKLMYLLKSFRGKKTVFITSHSLDLIADLCDKFLIMDKGAIVQTLEKKHFSDIESLKSKVKELLISENEVQNLSWLN
jgi:ABC-2 type transport system ATP-binding protein